MTRPLDPTQFTRESAERIANVVRAAELAAPAARPLMFEREDFFRSAKIFRVATYTGAWSIGTDKVVTFKNVTNTPNTASVTNLFFPVTNTAAGSRDCAIAKEGTAWYLIDVGMRTETAVFVTNSQTASYAASTTARVTIGSTQTAVLISSSQSSSVLTDVTLSASLNTSACTISIGKTLVTASRVFVTGTSTAVVLASTQTALFVASTATAIFVTGTTTATYLRLE